VLEGSRGAQQIERLIRKTMLARLQKFITVSIVSAALVWLFFHWNDSPMVACAGFLVIALGYSLVLGVEFIALRIVNHGDPAPVPTAHQLTKAWLGETLLAPQVFCWRQPFRANAIPDQLWRPAPGNGRRGVVFIHGFFCNRGFWTPWLERLKEKGNPFVAVNLEPVFGSIDEYVGLIEAAVQNVTRATGMPPVLVCHSMGGLAARAWIKAADGGARVHHVITIGTPHRGTWLGRFSKVTNGSQMRLSSDWLGKLVQDEGAAGNDKFTCWYSNCDNIVFPTSTATLPGANNRLVPGVAHVHMAFHRQVMMGSLAIIDTL